VLSLRYLVPATVANDSSSPYTTQHNSPQVKSIVPATHSSDRDCVAWLESNEAAVEELVQGARREFTATAVNKLLKVSCSFNSQFTSLELIL
jgi:hypothetical protein